MILSSADVQEYGGAYTGVEFWRAKMSDIQRVAFMSANPKVGTRTTWQKPGERLLLTSLKAQVYENTQFLYHEGLSFSQNMNLNSSEPDHFPSQMLNETNEGTDLGAGPIFEPDAPADLKVVSWAPRAPLGKTNSYAYNPENGRQAIIYIIENGIDGRNRVITYTSDHAQGLLLTGLGVSMATARLAVCTGRQKDGDGR